MIEIVPLGDRSLLVRLPGPVSEGTAMRVHAAVRAVEARRIAGVFDLVPAYTTFAVHFDSADVPAPSAYEWVRARVAEAIEADAGSGSEPGFAAHVRSHEIPVCYDPRFALDIEEVAERAGLRVQDVAELHASGDYFVAMLGFVPGFPYMLGGDARLDLPRRAAPRARVPAGSVAIAGRQTGIYPADVPGGWHVIGWTPLALFDVGRDPPARLAAGDRVRFRAITLEEARGGGTTAWR